MNQLSTCNAVDVYGTGANTALIITDIKRDSDCNGNERERERGGGGISREREGGRVGMR